MATLIPHLDPTNIEQAREMERTIVAEMSNGLAPKHVVERHEALRPDGSQLQIGLYRPNFGRNGSSISDGKASIILPVLVFLHGGSFVTGGLHTEDVRCQYYADAAECAVINVDYRLAPEHPFPAGLADGILTLEWLAQNAGVLGLDPVRVAIGGLSAGGALAAGMALIWRDRQRLVTQELQVVLQLLLHPVLDGTLRSRSVTTFEDTPIITAQHMRTCWNIYLGRGLAADDSQESAAGDPAAIKASPGLAGDLFDLPPVFISTSEFDPLRDEALAYSARLLDAEVPTELHLYARTFHSFDSFAATRMGRTALTTQVQALRTAMR